MQHVNMDLFIEEVRQRPAIYDTTMPEYCDRNYKRHLWMEICETFTTDWQNLEEEQKENIGREMKNRWKSIRDAFVREVRYMKEAARYGEPPVKKRKYIYYDQLSFLLPTVGSRSNGTNSNTKLSNSLLSHFLHNSYDDSMGDEPTALDLKKEAEPQDLHADSESDLENSIVAKNRNCNGLKEDSKTAKDDKINIWLNWNSKENNDHRVITQEENVEVTPIIDNMVSQHQASEPESISTNVYEGYGVTADPDYMFLMSLLPSFKKLEDETKSIIKIEISSVLHNAIYGSNMLTEQILLQENGRRSLRSSTNKKT